MAKTGASSSQTAPSSSPMQVIHQIRTTLDQDNYLLWKSQILPVLRGHGLEGFIDGSKQAPGQFVLNSTGVQVSNSDFSLWQQQDQLILAWMFSSIAPSILAQVINCQTSADLWQTLTQIHVSQSVAKTLDLKLQLQTLKKAGSTCSQFIQQLQAIADRLRSIGSVVTDQELILHALQGLGSEYEAFVTAISLREHSPSWFEFNNLLLTHESRILTNLKSNTTSTAHLTTDSQSQNNNNPSSQNVFYTSRGRSNRGRGYNTRGRGAQRGRGRGRQISSNAENNQDTSNSKCQICQKWGHEAIECYHRFDIRYSASSSSPTPQALVAEPSSTPQTSWFIDSGATTHVTPDINNLSSSLPYNGSDAVHIGNGTGLLISHKGTSFLSIGSTTLKLTNVLCVPSITKSLLSVSQLTADNNVVVEFSSNSCFVKECTTNKVLLHGILNNGLYKLVLPSQQQHVLHVSHLSADVWHSRLAHCSMDVIDKLRKSNVIKMKHSPSLFTCMGCNKAKAHKLPFQPSLRITSQPLEVVHSDLWGPAPVLSHKGHRYYVHFTDDFTKFSWIYTCASKSEVSVLFAHFKAKVENLLAAKIKTLQCDGGSEYKPLMTQYPEITFSVSCPYTPEQNGVAERKHRHIVELGLASMFQASIPLKYWDVIFESTVYVINRLPSHKHNAVSPFEMLFNQQPNYDLLHVLGCSCYPWLKPYTNHKLDARSEECVFLGYSSLHKGYYCLHLPTDRMYVSRHVKFVEQTFPFKCQQHQLQLPTNDTGVTTTLNILPVSRPSLVTPETETAAAAAPNQSSLATPSTIPQPTIPQTPLPATHPSIPRHAMVTRSQTKSLKPRTFPNHQAHTAVVHDSCQNNVEPTCYTQAVKSAVWRSAMAAELSALAHNNTWELVVPPPNAHIVGSKWIFKIKYKPDGSIERHKARLVAKGYTQEEGIDYEETFSPVVKPTTIRTVLTIALSNHWPCHQLDVNNAFLHGTLDETVFMTQPPGFSDHNFPHYVCKLNKAIYGLKQAPRAWFSKLKNFLLSHQFNCSQANNSLFILHKGNTLIYLLVYVDDILITGNDPSAVHALMQSLDHKFSLKNLGNLNHFLGIQVTYQSSEMHLSQTRYLSDILKRANMQHAKSCTTPMQSGKQISKYAGVKLSDPQQYRSIVGALQYATITRPDLTFAVNKASQFMATPTEDHWQLVKRILRYIQGTLQYGLVLKSAQHLSLHGYCDADWAGDPDDRRSTTGFAIYLGPNLISWSSKKQATVSKSSTEAEYRSLAVIASEILWLTYLLSELKYDTPMKPTLWCDNLGATFLASNPVFHARTKHIELDFHFVREKIQNKRLLVKFICSDDQLGDIFTKSLPKARFQLLRDKLHISPGLFSLRGAVEEVSNRELEESSAQKNGQDSGDKQN
ncbi:hypothetical protein LUZ62_053520 [Rhynchospora pubera]|uniref:Integrase catalytic domain-containing protein n=1 Tax=Rhynchospora pubera TaxID=906938 RepID=A0AAV8DS83_9POAL|nr:hypothetical protein LUZ62_053520 [Rhynchospora pubera]